MTLRARDRRPAADRAERIPARMILMLGLLTVCSPLCIDLYLPALPEITRDLHTSASAVQASITSCLIGIAMGQILVGPISDRLGRRIPLVVGLGVFILASVACAFAPNIVMLVVLRFAQGAGGAAGIVLGRAIVRDLYSGDTAARAFSLLMLVLGAGPLIAPQVGAGLLSLGSWRLLFVALAVAGVLLLLMTIFGLSETLPAERRHAGGFAETAHTLRLVATDRRFVVNAMAACLGYGAYFAYIAGSPFVFENVYGASPQQFGLIVAGNAVGLVGGSQVNGRLVGRFGAATLLTAGLTAVAVGGTVLVVVAVSGQGSLGIAFACLFVVIAGIGFVGPNAMALALNDFPHAAGSAAALLGVLQFAIGAVTAPLVGLGGSHAVLPMATIIAVGGLSAVGLRLIRTEPAPVGAPACTAQAAAPAP